MNDITIVVCGLASTTVLIAWMLKTGRTFAGFDAWWNRWFERWILGWIFAFRCEPGGRPYSIWADLDAWWDRQFEKLGAWFMRMASGWDDPTARKPEKRGRP